MNKMETNKKILISLQGLKIAGIIHDIAHKSIKDYVLVQAIKLFSMQTSQQVMQYIHIYGMLRFDRTSIYGVSKTFRLEHIQ